MTDSQLLFGILQNDERAWKHIYQEMRYGFTSIIAQSLSNSKVSNEDIEDIFQESLIILMQKAKGGCITIAREGSIFSYLVQIGKFIACNLLRKKRGTTSNEAVTILNNSHNEETELSVDEKQQTQDDFLDKALDLLPAECKALLKYFYWERKPMDDIASLLGMRNADSAKTKKSKCMNKFKDIATQLVESEEFAEEAIRNAVERAALRELLTEEKAYTDGGFCIAALDIDNDNKEK